MRRPAKGHLGRRVVRTIVTLAGSFLLACAGLAILDCKLFHTFALAEGKGLDGPEIEALETQNKAYERIAEAVTPAIVNIQTTQVIRVRQSPYFNDPFFRQFFGEAFPQFNIPRERREHALGSGVIVSPDGFIVTNNHVIEKATTIEVMLADKRLFKGKVVGSDSQTDVAVIKVDGKNLPTAPWGPSADLKVGHTVMAFGNPFGLSFTVTKGIVSAVGRSGLGIENYEDFIQTDAAINPGNSGGALVDVRGRVVGINTAILSAGASPSGEGGFNGVGLAIPADIVKHVMESLIKTGKVERGYLGVTVGDLSEKLARQFNVPSLSGALVDDVAPGSPADKAGLRQGDVIRTVDGRDVPSKDALTSMVAAAAPGATVALGILRDGKPMTIKVSLATRPANLSLKAGSARVPETGTLRGITVQELTPSLREQLGLPARANGVVITSLDPEGPAAQEGLQEGDVIQAINHQPVNSAADFARLAAAAKADVLLRIVRQGNGLFVVLSPIEAGEGE